MDLSQRLKIYISGLQRLGKVNMAKKKLFNFVTVFVLAFSGSLTSATFFQANAASITVTVPCDGTSIPGLFAQAFTVAPGDSVDIVSDPAGSCDRYYSQTTIFPTLTPYAPTVFPGSLSLTVDNSAVPGDYYITFYQTKLGSSHPNDDWGQKIKFTVPTPTYQYSISGCNFTPTSNNVNYGETKSTSLTLTGTADPSTSELTFWHERLLDGAPLPPTDPNASQGDVISNLQLPYTFNYGSSYSAPYYYAGKTLTENLYAINPNRDAPYGPVLCTLTTTFGPAPSTTGTQQLAYTSESCLNIKNNNAKLISNFDATLGMKGNKQYISGINPGSAFYWAKVNLNGATSTTLFTQSTSSGNLRLSPMGSNYIYDSNCNLAKKGPVVSVDKEGNSAIFSGGVSGNTYYIAIKLGPNNIVNQSVPGSWPVTLSFTPGFGASAFNVTITPKKA